MAAEAASRLMIRNSVRRMGSAFRSAFDVQRGAVCLFPADPNLNGAFIRRSGSKAQNSGMRRHFLLAMLAIVLCGFSPNQGGGGRSFGDIMDSISQRYPGKVLGADRGRRNGRSTYRLKILTEDGNVLSIEADAASGKILSVRGRGGRRRR